MYLFLIRGADTCAVSAADAGAAAFFFRRSTIFISHMSQSQTVTNCQCCMKTSQRPSLAQRRQRALYLLSGGISHRQSCRKLRRLTFCGGQIFTTEAAEMIHLPPNEKSVTMAASQWGCKAVCILDAAITTLQRNMEWRDVGTEAGCTLFLGDFISSDGIHLRHLAGIVCNTCSGAIIRVYPCDVPR
jgi:hypothetical protein